MTLKIAAQTLTTEELPNKLAEAITYECGGTWDATKPTSWTADLEKIVEKNIGKEEGYSTSFWVNCKNGDGYFHKKWGVHVNFTVTSGTPSTTFDSEKGDWDLYISASVQKAADSSWTSSSPYALMVKSVGHRDNMTTIQEVANFVKMSIWNDQNDTGEQEDFEDDPTPDPQINNPVPVLSKSTNWLQKIARPQHALLGEPIIAYRAVNMSRAEQSLKNGFNNGQYFTTDPDRAVFYANFNSDNQPGAIFECTLDSSHIEADMNDASDQQREEAYRSLNDAAGSILHTIEQSDFSIDQHSIEYYLGNAIGADIGGYYDQTFPRSIWMFLSQDLNISIEQAKSILPPGHYDNVFIDSRGVPGFTEIESAQLTHAVAVPPENIHAIYIHSDLLNKINLPYDKLPNGSPDTLFRDYVNVIPYQRNEFVEQLEEQINELDYMQNDGDNLSPEEQQMIESREALTDEIKSLSENLQYDEESVLDGPTYRKLRSGEPLTLEDFENRTVGGFIKFELPKQRMQALLVIRKSLQNKEAMTKNWLQKISSSYDVSFFLFQGELIFFKGLHGTWLREKLGLPDAYTEFLRFAFPRGRISLISALKDSVYIEASPELEPYKSKIAAPIGRSPDSHTITWTFEDMHYDVWPREKLIKELSKVYKTYSGEKYKRIIEPFVPGFSQAAEEYKQQTEFKIIPECVGAAHGQTDCVLKAYLPDTQELVGYISYAIFEGDIHVQYIETRDDMKRKGIASQLSRALQQEANELEGKIEWGMSTPEGTAFLQGAGIKATASTKISGLWEDIYEYGPSSMEGKEQPYKGGYSYPPEKYDQQYRYNTQYSFSVPTLEIINKLKQFIGDEQVIEIGAGKGMWAKLMQDAGIKITPTDLAAGRKIEEIDRPSTIHPENPYYNLEAIKEREYEYDPNTFTDVYHMSGEEALKHFGDHTVLFLGHPPYGNPMAYEILKAFQGDKVIYVGEWGGNTADDQFHHLLDKEWKKVKKLNMPNFRSINSSVYLFVRRY